MLHVLSYHDSPLIRLIIVCVFLLYMYFFLTSTDLWVVVVK